MWPFRPSKYNPVALARVTEIDGIVHIDVKGQSCPNYLVSIQRAFESLPPGKEVKLFLTYGPGDGDVRAWCEARKILILGMEENNGTWAILLKKPATN